MLKLKDGWLRTRANVIEVAAKSSWEMNGGLVQEELSGEFIGKPFTISPLRVTTTSSKNTATSDLTTSTRPLYDRRGSRGRRKDDHARRKYDWPMIGIKDTLMKEVIRIISDDKRAFKTRDPSKGDAKTMI